MTSDADIKQLFAQGFDELPAELKRAIEAVSPLEKIIEIGKKNNLRLDQIGTLGEIVNEFILGYISAPAEFISEIKTRLDAGDDKSVAVAREINAEIFLPIREALKKATSAGTRDQALGTRVSAGISGQALGARTGDQVLGTRDRTLGTGERGTAVQEVKPLVIRPITGIERRGADALKLEAGNGKQETVPMRMEDVKIPGPKADLNGKISPIISRIGIQRTAEKGTREQALGTREQGTKIAMPIIEEVKQPKIAVPPPVPEPRVLPSAKPSLYDEIKARAEWELKELIEKERGEGASGQALGTREQPPPAVKPAIPPEPAPQIPPPSKPAASGAPTLLTLPQEQTPLAVKPAIPPTPKPLKLPQEKIPKPQAPEKYSTDPYRESVE